MIVKIQFLLNLQIHFAMNLKKEAIMFRGNRVIVYESMSKEVKEAYRAALKNKKENKEKKNK